MILTLLLAFLAGAAVMALEIMSSRWLAPVFGFTLTTWAFLISITLLAGALGAGLGGCHAHRGRGLLGGLFLAAAAWVGLEAVLAPGFVTGLLERPLIPGIALACTFLLLIPVAAISGVVPVLVHLHSSAPGIARRVGALIAASTTGSLAGTLLAALWLVPVVGLRRAAFGVAAALAAAGALALRGRTRWLAGLLACGGALAAWHSQQPGSSTDLVCATPYGLLELELGELGFVLRIDGINQAAVSALSLGRGGLLERRCYLELLPYLRPAAKSALCIGLGGGLVNRALREYGIDVETIEINPVLVEVARERLGFDGTVRIGDGRREWRRDERRRDFIVLDAFQGESLPCHLLSLEAVEELRQRLAPGGILALHLIAPPGHAATAAIARTLRERFPSLLAVRSGLEDELQDLYLFASEAPLHVPPHPELLRRGWLGNEVFEPPAGGALLSDDCNPLELLYEPLARRLRQASLDPR